MTDLVRKGVQKLQSVAVRRRFEPQEVGYVHGTGRAGLALEATKIRLDLTTVDLDLTLVRKGDVLDAGVRRSTENHNSL